MEEKIFPYLVAVSMPHHPGIDMTNEHVAPANFTSPALYCPPISVVVHGMENPRNFDLNDESLTLEKMVEQGLAMPLVGFRGHVLLQHAIWLQGYDPREYFLDDFPQYAKIPDNIIGIPDYGEDVDYPEEAPNVLILEDFDIFTSAGVRHLDHILDRLNTLILGSCSIPVNIVVYPSPKLSEILAHPFLDLEASSLRGYFESFYDENFGKPQAQPKIVNMADYLTNPEAGEAGDSAAASEKGDAPAAGGSRERGDVVTHFPGDGSMDDQGSEDSVEDLLDELLGSLTDPDNRGIDLGLMLDLMEILAIEDVRTIQRLVRATLEEAENREGSLDPVDAAEMTSDVILDALTGIPGLDYEALEKSLDDYRERVEERQKDEERAPSGEAGDEGEGETEAKASESGKVRMHPRNENVPWDEFNLDDASSLDYRVFLAIRLVLNGFARCVPVDEDFLFRNYDENDYDYDDEDYD